MKSGDNELVLGAYNIQICIFQEFLTGIWMSIVRYSVTIRYRYLVFTIYTYIMYRPVCVSLDGIKAAQFPIVQSTCASARAAE